MMRFLLAYVLLLMFTLSGCAAQTGIENNSSQQAAPPSTSQGQSVSPGSTPTAAPLPDHIARILSKAPVNPIPDPNKGIPKVLETRTAANNKTMPAVKGIYVSAWKAQGSSLDKLITLLHDTKLNAMVIDAKNDTGQITYDSDVPLANEIGSDDTRPIADMKAVLQKLKQNDIYTIARIVVFKDPYLSGVRKDMAMHTKNGAVWKDKKGIAWVDPYHSEVQNYNIAVAKEAAQLGFDEIQFDYVRFPENGKKVDAEVAFRNINGLSKAELIEHFLRKAKEALPHVPISADVFGLTPSIEDDMGIGQEWNKISPVIDVISPMVYPSHYRDGALGINQPDLQPYSTVQRAMLDAVRKNTKLMQGQKQPAKIRPWLQDFTATWVKNHQTYGTAQVKEQIKAAEEQGVDQFLLWNPSCNYTYRD